MNDLIERSFGKHLRLLDSLNRSVRKEVIWAISNLSGGKLEHIQVYLMLAEKAATIATHGFGGRPFCSLVLVI